jgi:2-polyprenyl-6-methoxyphenol hydroxylase-like FAD-dependent oxidoreductase
MTAVVTADIAIIGAGVAGCIAAIALAPTHRVAFIHKHATPPERIGESLPPAARRIFRRLNLLAEFERQPHLTSQGMQSSWGSDKLQITDNLRNPDGFGWHLDRPAFESFLRATAKQRGVFGVWPANLTASQFGANRWHLQTDPSTTIEAKWVLDAGGRSSPFVRQQGVQRTTIGKSIAIWATVPDNSKNRMGLISATHNGWWYSAPVPDAKRVICLNTDADLIDRKAHKTLSGFLRLAHECPPIKKYLGNMTKSLSDQDGTVTCVAANSTKLQQVTGKQWAALGDAAISFDPLSSQGMFNAMASAMQLVDLIAAGQSIETEYTGQIERIWQHYLTHRCDFYRQETRWQDQPFWQRRQ